MKITKKNQAGFRRLRKLWKKVRESEIVEVEDLTAISFCKLWIHVVS